MASVIWRTGDTDTLTVTVTDDGTNEVESLAGSTITYSLYDDNNVVMATFTTDDFTTSGGVFTRQLATTDLDEVDESGAYHYALRITDASGRSQSESGIQVIEKARV